MIKPLCLLAALLVSPMLAKPAFAALHPLELTSVPADDPSFSAADNALQLSLNLGLRKAVPAPRPQAAPTPQISLTTNPADVAASDFLVGKDTLISLPQHAGPNWRIRPSFDQRDAWNYINRQVTGPDSLERLADMFDIEETERPWSTTTMVHLLAATPEKGMIVPYASLAHEIDVNEDFERFGLGAGAMLMLGKNASLGAELIYFAGSRANINDDFGRETRFLTRLQFEF